MQWKLDSHLKTIRVYKIKEILLQNWNLSGPTIKIHLDHPQKILQILQDHNDLQAHNDPNNNQHNQEVHNYHHDHEKINNDHNDKCVTWLWSIIEFAWVQT